MATTPAAGPDAIEHDVIEQNAIEQAERETTPPPIVEVQGWARNAQGQIELVAEVPQQTTGRGINCGLHFQRD